MQVTVIMALVKMRSCGRHGFDLGLRAYATRPIGSQRKREQQDDTPVFQYVGQHRKPQEKVFVWGFSFTGALGIPSFVVPDSGRKKPRKYQLTPYRLDTEQKVRSYPSFTKNIWNGFSRFYTNVNFYLFMTFSFIANSKPYT